MRRTRGTAGTRLEADGQRLLPGAVRRPQVFRRPAGRSSPTEQPDRRERGISAGAQVRRVKASSAGENSAETEITAVL